MDSIAITLEEVTRTANAIHTHNESLFQCLKEIHTAMNQLSTSWQSPAGETIRTRFQSMLPIFENYKSIVGTYSTFLHQTVSTYQQLEMKINASADTFK